MGRCSKPLNRFRAYSDQLVDLPNSPSSTTSMPACACRRTTSATLSVRNLSYDRSSTARPSCRARTKSSSFAGRIRLPTCVVSIRFVLRFILSLTQMRPDFTTLLAPPQHFNSRKISAIPSKEDINPATGYFGTLSRRGRDTSGFSDYFVVSFVFVYDAKPLRNFPGWLEFVEFWRTDPDLRVRFRVVDGDLQFQGVMIQPPIALGKVRLVTPRIPIGIDPLLVVEPNRFDNECVSFPLANRVPQPTGVGIFGKWPPVRPDGAPNVLLLEEHEHPARNLYDLKWVGVIEKLGRAVRIAAQGRSILLTRDSLRSHQGSRGLEPRLPPRRQGRAKSLIHGIHAGRSWHIPLRILHPNSRQIMGEGWGRVSSLLCIGRLTGLRIRDRQKGQSCTQDREQSSEPCAKNIPPRKTVVI